MLSERLKMLREEKGLKQDTLASELGCTRYMISYYENGREPPNDVLIAYCQRFNVSSDFLLGLSNERKPASGALSASLEILSPLAGRVAFTATDLSSLVDSAVLYYKAGAPCGDTPLVAFNGFIDGLTSALTAAVVGDGPATHSGANAAVVAALEITKMPTLVYELQKGDA